MRVRYRPSYITHQARLIAFAIVTAVLMPALAACDPTPGVTIVSSDHSKRGAVKVEVADTPDKRATGLMYRKDLDEDAGMLFIFRDPAPVEFWMKNTFIPLDMIFVDASGKVIGIVANAEPYSEKNVGGFPGALYVLEVNGGYAKRHGVVTGDVLEFRGFDPHTTR